MEQQKTSSSQQNIKRKTDTTQIKIYHEVIVIEIIQYWQKNNQIDPCNYSQLIIGKDDRKMIYKT